MKKNMGSTDRVLRILAALVLAWLYYNRTIEGTFGLVLLVLSIVFVLTSLLGFCPIYLPFGIKSNKKTGR